MVPPRRQQQHHADSRGGASADSGAAGKVILSERMPCSTASQGAVLQQHGKATAELSLSLRLPRLCSAFPAAANQLWVLYRLYCMSLLYTGS